MDDEFASYATARWPHLVRAALLLGCQLPDAENLVQDTLVKVMQRWRRIQRADNPDAYVHRMLVNALRSSRRSRRVREQPLTTWNGEARGVSVDDTTRSDEADDVAQALRRLPDEQRVVVVLRYFCDLSEQQMSDVLGIAPGTVKSRLSRARAALAKDPSMRLLGGTNHASR